MRGVSSRMGPVPLSKRGGSGVLLRGVVGLMVAGAILFGPTGCDSGPSGPGELSGTLDIPGTPLGGVALEVTGPGIESFSGAGGTRVLWAATGQPDTYRVVTLNQTGGPVRFQVSVQDVGADKPRALIVSLVDANNGALTLTDEYTVSFTR